MKYFLPLLVILFTTLLSNEKTTFIEEASKFHKMDIKTDKSKKELACVFCHIVDDIENTSSNWLNQKQSIEANIDNYDSSNGEPDSFSKACLICHDGNMASMVLNAPISPCGIKSTAPVSSNGANHPVFMVYNDRKDFKNSSSNLNGIWSEATQVSDLLRNQKIVCISCHIPHHTKESGYLRTSMKNSQLCMGCHKK